MRFRELPGFPSLFVDFVEGAGGARDVFPCRPEAGTLRARAPRASNPVPTRKELCDVLMKQAGLFGSGDPARANIARLNSPGCVVIAATLRPGLLGGPLRSCLKALTAARLADWLSGNGLPAIPVVWVESTLEPSDLVIGLLASHALEKVGLSDIHDGAADLPDSITDFQRRVSALTKSNLPACDILRLLDSVYVPGTSMSLAWGRAFSKMLELSGVVLFDPNYADLVNRQLDIWASRHFAGRAELATGQENRLRAAGYAVPAEILSAQVGRFHTKNHDITTKTRFFRQSLCFPVAAFVIDESDIFAAAAEQEVYSVYGQQAPVLWPRVSATLVDQRCRKLLVRYDLGLKRLFAGPRNLTNHLMETRSEPDADVRLASMKTAIEGKLSELAGLVPPGDRLAKAVSGAHRRMAYQMEKLGAAFAAAWRRRRQIVERHADYLCGHLAPWGGMQERELAGFQFISPSATWLYQSIDPWRFEHQLIFL